MDQFTHRDRAAAVAGIAAVVAVVIRELVGIRW
jgi:hypothetical protein